jgi:hypothetical protein
MDLKKAILKEYSKVQMDRIVKYVGNNPDRFGNLVEVFLAGPYRITQRASWALSCCVEKHPVLIKVHLKPILDQLSQPDAHDSVKRNIIRLLQFIDIPKRYHGVIADRCFSFLQSKTEAVAIKAFSITVLAKLIEHEPDLAQELKIILEDQLPYAKPAFRVRAKKFLGSHFGNGSQARSLSGDAPN